MAEQLMTTQEVAALLGVGPTAIKRWSDGGALPCLRTAGGHRRYRRSDVDRLVQRSGPVPADDASPNASGWLEELLSGPGVVGVESMLMRERAARGSWHAVGVTLGRWLEEIGRAWQEGRLSILQEHVISERLARAIADLGERLPVSPGAPCALLVVPDGEEHTLGLSIAEICLRDAGWRTRWAGRATPVGEVVAAAGDRTFDMVVASASMHEQDEEKLRRWTERVAAACTRASIPLLLGGQGAWPASPSGGIRIRGFEPLYTYALGLASARPGRQDHVS